MADVIPYYDQGGITIYHGDCRDILPTLEPADLVLTDPPYGIDYKAGDSSQRGIQAHARIAGDSTPFDPEHVLTFPDVICWGANHYARRLPEHEGQFYCWDKVCQNDMKVRIAECEYAWHKQGTKPRVYRHLWSGAYRASEAGQRSLHPSQKPIALMSWCLKLAGDVTSMVDPYMGVGTSLVAAKLAGIKAVGIELEEKYCEIAASRLSQQVLQLEGAT